MSLFFSKYGIGFSVLTIGIAIVNAIFWLIAARQASANDIGIASSIYNTSLLAANLALLGTEYSLLKSIPKDKTYFGSLLVFELLINIILAVIVVFSLQRITSEYILSMLSILILFSAVFAIIPRYSLLGSLSIKSVIITDALSTIVKFVLLIWSLQLHLGPTGILLAFLSQLVTSGAIFSILSFRKFGFHFNINSLKTTLREGLANFPIDFSRLLQYFGSIPILTFLGLTGLEIAGFTIATSIFYFLTLLPTTLLQVTIPSSTKLNLDLSSTSMRIGMVLVAPLIAVLLLSPSLIMGIYSVNYTKFSEILRILALSLIPFILTTNVITMLNNQGLFRKLFWLGILESSVFFSSMVLLVPKMGLVGGAWAFVLSFLFSGTFAFIITNNKIRKIFLVCVGAIATGYVSGTAINLVAHSDYLAALTGFCVTILCMFLFKEISPKEISLFIGQLKRK